MIGPVLPHTRDVYPEWCLEFFSMMYFDRGVDRTRAGSKERCQKRDMWMMSAMEELQGINLAWVIPEHLCKHASGLKENSLICGGHYMTKIDHSLGYLNDEDVEKCLEPIECEIWTLKMLANEDVWKDSILIRNNYILEHSATILHHLADQSNFAYPAYEPPNVPPYPYTYVPFPYPYTHYPDTGSPSFGRDHFGAHGDSYHAGSIVSSFGYKIGGSSAGFHGDDFDSIVNLEDCVQTILHHLADQSDFAYPAYEPPNVPPYPYTYVPFPYSYTHYPNTGSPSFGRDHFRAHGDSYHAGSIVLSSGYEIGGSSVRFHGDDFDLIVHLEDCLQTILHHLADQSDFAYPAYEPPNVPPYPYTYVPFPYSYTHYPNTGSPSFGRDHFRAHGDSYHAGSIVLSSGYEIGGSSARFHGDDFDSIVHLEDCLQSNDDEIRD
nr:hypothetical protein [Tanacetum cinerariifolium]